MTYPNTGTQFLPRRTNTGLSTQIIIKVNGAAVGALQTLNVNQTRQLKRINEIGTDGNIEIVPQQSTTYDLTATRVVFDQLRLPEAFSRAFRVIGAQRVPFDIEVFDLSAVTPPDSPVDSSSSGIVVMSFQNCWFTNYSTPFNAEDFTILESATIWAETASVKSTNPFTPPSTRYVAQTDVQGIEGSTNTGARRGSLDASGILNSVFTTE